MFHQSITRLEKHQGYTMRHKLPYISLIILSCEKQISNISCALRGMLRDVLELYFTTLHQK